VVVVFRGFPGSVGSRNEVDGVDADTGYGRLGVGDGPSEAAGEVSVEVVGHHVVRSLDS
jgi:hypothetical protein